VVRWVQVRVIYMVVGKWCTAVAVPCCAPVEHRLRLCHDPLDYTVVTMAVSLSVWHYPPDR